MIDAEATQHSTRRAISNHNGSAKVRRRMDNAGHRCGVKRDPAGGTKTTEANATPRNK